MTQSKKGLTFLLVGLFVALASAGIVRAWDDDDQAQKLKLLGTAYVPEVKPVTGTDIATVNQNTGTLVYADRTNGAVEVVDGVSDVYLGRVTSTATGVTPALTFTGPVATTTPSTVAHQGPNGVLETDDKIGFAGDGDATVKVFDLNPKNTTTYLHIIGQINTAGQSSISNCLGGVATVPTACNRADEMTVDEGRHILMVNTDQPTAIQPYSTFALAQSPFTVLGQLNYGVAVGSGLEQPVWDPQIHRFLQTLPVTTTTGTGSIVVIKVELSPTFSATVERTISLASYNCSPSGLALAPNGHVVTACAIPGAKTPSPTSYPLVLDVASGLQVGPTITEVGGGDEVNYNPGNNEFVVAAALDGITSNPRVLALINADNGKWIENLPPATPASNPGVVPPYGTGGLNTTGGSGNLAALGSNNHVFVIVHPVTGTALTNGATNICGTFGGVDYGCVAVFGPKHVDIDNDHHDDDHHDHDNR